jgi:flagellar hook-basal body complex protein FliE
MHPVANSIPESVSPSPAPLSLTHDLAQVTAGSTAGTTSFAETLHALLQQVDGAQHAAAGAIEQFVAGENVPLHAVSLQLAQADLSLRFMLEVRERAVNAFQEVMRTQL